MLKNKQINYQNYAYCISKYFDKSSNSICLIAKDSFESKYIYNELCLLMDKELISYFPENDILPYDHFSIPEKITKERFKIINENKKTKHILISSVKNLFEKFPNRHFYKSRENFNLGDKLSTENLIKIIESLNYQKKVNIENINEYSVRGGITDIYSPMYKNPLRIEIFDEQIESIRFFDVESQLSIKKLDKFSLSKGSFFNLDDNKISMFIDRWRDYFVNEDERYCSIFQEIKNFKNPEGVEVYFPFFFNETCSFKELFCEYDYIKCDELIDEVGNYELLINERFEDETNDSNRPLIKPSDLFVNSDDIFEFISSIHTLETDEINFKYNSFKELEESLLSKVIDKKVVIITSIPSELEKLKVKYSTKASVINHINEIHKDISIMYGEIVRPMHVLDKNILIIHKEFVNKSTYKIQVSNRQTIKKERLYDLFDKKDFVIHEDYGLGIYDGLELIEADNRFGEYLKIIYADNEILYVPLKNISKISNYHKNADVDVNLDSLSSSKWSVKKKKAANRVFDHAAEILDIESRRNNSNSTSLKVDEKLLSDFENEFPYIETPDQLESILSIKKDLSLVKPMNRVLCGDVGFGKTEVAMRSAFISVFSDKQVIVITPSTILCEQHYNSFLKRFENFPVSIQKLNRFNTKKNKDKIIQEFNSKKIDILITTHIVFNNNINFGNTGLLVIDEEHKFGIKQKNYIKDKQSNIHILYLSATPIPRTMNLVFSGLKEFSFLQTPPANRVSIKSFLKVQTSQLLKEALSREKIRGGQCFIVQNDISKMEALKKEIDYILPNFNVAIAHGRLSKVEIRKIMNEFKNGEIDGLICTTIIEMGLDISNANTMIIINSHNFGLSQLHQLRGRVGRSQKQGYCYFLIPTMDIPKLSRNRLDSIIRHSNLGEGFMIAQEDLEIRGGGEMLGDKQSGHIDNIGMSLYLSMLKDAIKSQKEGVNNINLDIEINFYDSAYINENYLPSPIERLKIYKKINNVESHDDLKILSSNLEDRCGKIPKETLNLIDNKKINLRLVKNGIKSVKSNQKNTNIELTNNISDLLLNKLIDLASKYPEKYQIDRSHKFIYKLNELDSNIRRKNVNLLLDELL